MERLMKKWGITSNFQFWVIMVVFSLAGMSVVRAKALLYPILGLGPDTPQWLRIAAWPVVVLPTYYLLFMFWGTLLGQFKFAWWFTRKTLVRLRILAPPQESESSSDLARTRQTGEEARR